MMRRAVTGTILSKATATLMNLLVIALAGHRLGAGGIGEISLIVLGITIIMLLNNLVGGGALTFLVPRHSLKDLLPPTYAWALATAGIAFLLLQFLPVVAEDHKIHLVVLAFMQSIYTIHLNVLLGQERIRMFNVLVALQMIVLFGAFYWLTSDPSGRNVMSFIHASYAAFGVTLIGSTLALLTWSSGSTIKRASAIRKLFGQGSAIQVANIAQLFNYRLSYYLIEHFMGLAALGIFSVGTQLSEGAWMVPKSIGTVLYSKVSNLTEKERQIAVTLRMMRFSMAASVFVLFILLMLPDVVFSSIFGEEVTGIPILVILLAPGIVAMAGSQALSHYFSGIGANRRNAIASLIGLAITVSSGLLLIPGHGIQGAAVTASLAYSGLFIYQWIVFVRETQVGLKEFVPGRGEMSELWRSMRSLKGPFRSDP